MKMIRFFLILAFTALVTSCVSQEEAGKDPDTMPDRFDEDVSSPLPSSTQGSAPSNLGKPDPTKNPPTAKEMKEFRASVQSLAKGREGELTDCYSKTLKYLPITEGELTIEWVINEKGIAEKTTVAKNNTGSQDLGTCVADTTKKWTFPLAPKGQAVSVEYPFKFKK